MLLDWLPARDLYISEILDQEQAPVNMLCPKCQSNQGLLRCEDCFAKDVLCHNCCLTIHQNMPFHSIRKWTGRFFQVTSLDEEGFTLYLGHSGAPCPEAPLETNTQESQASGIVDEGDIGEGISSGAGWAGKKKCLAVVDVSGVHQLHIGWCQCKGAPGADIQLLRSRLFPASISKPSTVFTFRVLNYFHIDSVECKTSASSFFSKLRRLTNNSSPDSVPVSFLVDHPCATKSTMPHRTVTEN